MAGYRAVSRFGTGFRAAAIAGIVALGVGTTAAGQTVPQGAPQAAQTTTAQTTTAQTTPARTTAAKTGVKFTEETLTIRTKTGSIVFTVELADSEAERAQGLMHRESLAADRGMLFDFETSRHVYMWMRNTLIPLDMLFIDSRGRIISIAGARPLSERQISSGGEILGVLELNAGTARARGIRVGDIVEHRLFKTAAAPKPRK